MKLATYTELGGINIPQEVRRLRRETWDFHRRLGTPVVLKHKWNEEDVQKGLAQHCPYCRDAAYKQGRDRDEHCFGTGYLGGYDDGVITFVTLGDTLEDIFKINEQGLLMRDKHPICTAPWMPRMYDGDILVTADFDPDTWDIISLGERFVLKEVTPVEPRGAGGALTAPPFARSYKGRNQTRKHLVAQNFQIDRLPDTDIRYEVPVEFVYVGLPTPPVPAPGVDPDTYPDIPEIAAAERMLIIHGGGQDVIIVFPKEDEMTTSLYERREIRLTGISTDFTSSDIRIVGD